MKPTDLKCYKQVAAVIGEAYADYELQLVIDCPICQVRINGEGMFESFSFDYTPQGHEFWAIIHEGKNPYEHGHDKPELGIYTNSNKSKVMTNEEIKSYVDDLVHAGSSEQTPDYKIGACLNNGPVLDVSMIVNVPESENVEKEISKVTAASILEAGLGHMQDRAVTYDNPQGERSMGKTVDMFNVLYGLELTEEQGWAFMAILKLVRTSQGDFKLDNFEDLAAYAGLMGEAAAKG